MADSRIKEYWSNEMESLLKVYKQFQCLIPAEGKAGSAHNGEDGRYVEYLIREYLQKYLPKELEVLTGFVLRPAVVCGNNNKSRKQDKHDISGQLDIIVYDTAHYPVYQRFDECVIVPPEGVISVISVKKHLRLDDIHHELPMLSKVCNLCVHDMKQGIRARSPFTALITMEDKIDENIKKKKSAAEKADLTYERIQKLYSSKDTLFYDEMVDFVGSLSEWGLYKERPKNNRETNYMFFDYESPNNYFGFQLLLQNILSVYYANTSNLRARPGFTDNRNMNYKKKYGPISYSFKECSVK